MDGPPKDALSNSSAGVGDQQCRDATPGPATSGLLSERTSCCPLVIAGADSVWPKDRDGSSVDFCSLFTSFV